jgi:hypothetical protein
VTVCLEREGVAALVEAGEVHLVIAVRRRGVPSPFIPGSRNSFS